VDAPLFRLPIVPSRLNGLDAASQLMIDKVTTVAEATLQRRVGQLADEDMTTLSHAVLVFLGLSR